MLLKEFSVVNAQLIEQHINHGEGKGSICAGTDWYPFIGFGGSVVTDRIDGDYFHSFFSGFGYVLCCNIGIKASAKAGLIP